MENIMEFFENNGYDVFNALLMVFSFLFLHKGARKHIILSVIYKLVCQAEKQFGSGKGSEKHKSVLEAFYNKLPPMLKIFIPHKEVLKIIEIAVKKMNKKFKDTIKQELDSPNNSDSIVGGSSLFGVIANATGEIISETIEEFNSTDMVDDDSLIDEVYVTVNEAEIDTPIESVNPVVTTPTATATAVVIPTVTVPVTVPVAAATTAATATTPAVSTTVSTSSNTAKVYEEDDFIE